MRVLGISLIFAAITVACTMSGQLPATMPIPTVEVADTSTSIIPSVTHLPKTPTSAIVPYDSTATAVVQEFCPAESGDWHELSFSTTGQYVAFTCMILYSPDISQTIVVELENPRIVTTISFRRDYWKKGYSDPLSDDEQGTVRSFGEFLVFHPVRWSQNDQYLYLDVRSPVDGGYIYGGVVGLFQLNVESGTLKKIFDNGHFTYEFTHDETKLFFVNQLELPLTLVVFDIPDNKKFKFGLEKNFRWAGRYSPSPDGKYLIVEVADSNMEKSLTLFDLYSHIRRENIIESAAYYDFRWINTTTIYVSAEYYPEGTQQFLFDVDTNARILIPTPTPEQ
jgi:hypothetical protein